MHKENEMPQEYPGDIKHSPEELLRMNFELISKTFEKIKATWSNIQYTYYAEFLSRAYDHKELINGTHTLLYAMNHFADELLFLLGHLLEEERLKAEIKQENNK